MTKNKTPKKRQGKQIVKGSVLTRLVNNKLLASKVNEALDRGAPYDDIIDLCLEYEFDISKSSLSRYKDKREEAIREGLPIEDVVDGRIKGKIIDIAKKEVRTSANTSQGSIQGYDTAQDKLYNDVEFLDEIIEKGFKGLKHVTVVDPQLAMKAIEIKKKVTGDSLQGMSVAGLKELNMRNLALQNVISEVLFKYIPEDKHDEVLDYMEEVEKEFFDNLDLTEEDRRLNKALENTSLA